MKIKNIGDNFVDGLKKLIKSIKECFKHIKEAI